MADKVYVARLDTGGISYSGREYVAVGLDPAQAKDALMRAYRADHRVGGFPRNADNQPLNTLARVEAWYGDIPVIEVYVGYGTRVDL